MEIQSNTCFRNHSVIDQVFKSLLFFPNYFLISSKVDMGRSRSFSLLRVFSDLEGYVRLTHTTNACTDHITSLRVGSGVFLYFPHWWDYFSFGKKKHRPKEPYNLNQKYSGRAQPKIKNHLKRSIKVSEKEEKSPRFECSRSLGYCNKIHPPNIWFWNQRKNILRTNRAASDGKKCSEIAGVGPTRLEPLQICPRNGSKSLPSQLKSSPGQTCCIIKFSKHRSNDPPNMNQTKKVWNIPAPHQSNNTHWDWF